MSEQREVVVLSGVRTAIGDYGGSLKDVPPVELASAVVREAIARAGVDAGQIGHVVFGNVIHTEPRDMYMARAAAVGGGIPVEVLGVSDWHHVTQEAINARPAPAAPT